MTPPACMPCCLIPVALLRCFLHCSLPCRLFLPALLLALPASFHSSALNQKHHRCATHCPAMRDCHFQLLALRQMQRRAYNMCHRPPPAAACRTCVTAVLAPAVQSAQCNACSSPGANCAPICASLFTPITRKGGTLNSDATGAQMGAQMDAHAPGDTQPAAQRLSAWQAPPL